jgi:hypothetical protein
MEWEEMQQKGAITPESYCTIRGYDCCGHQDFGRATMMDADGIGA